MTGLCEVAAAVREDLGTVSRQREAEKKKVDKGTAGSKERLKELEKKVKEVHWKKSRLELYLNEFFNT
jgi:archaellum component FlaC